MAKSNFQGQVILYAELYDTWYKLMFVDNTGKVLRISDPSPFVTTTPYIQINTEEDLFSSFIFTDGVRRNLSFINLSGQMYARLVYYSPSPINSVCLQVDKVTANGITRICYNCSSSPATTITCKINPAFTHKAIAMIDTLSNHSANPADTIWYNKLPGIQLGLEGVFYAVLIIFTMALLGISALTTSLILLAAGLIGVFALGFILGIQLTGLWYVIVIIGIILFIYRKGTVSW